MKFAALAVSLLGAAVSASAAAIGNDYVSFVSDEHDNPMAVVAVSMAKLFPAATADLTGFDLDVGYSNYNVTLFQKITNDLGDAKGTIESKAGAVVSTLYGKEFISGAHSEMDEDYNRLVTAAHPNSSLQARGDPYITWTASNTVDLYTCRFIFACISSSICKFYISDNSPRSRCEAKGDQNCCTSWSSPDVVTKGNEVFFRRTWEGCLTKRSSAQQSCEGHDSGSGNGGNVCFRGNAKRCI